jgi:hypothetical protein
MCHITTGIILREEVKRIMRKGLIAHSPTKEVKKMKKALIVLMALAIFTMMAGVALANDPNTAGDNITYTETSNTPEGA